MLPLTCELAISAKRKLTCCFCFISEFLAAATARSSESPPRGVSPELRTAPHLPKRRFIQSLLSLLFRSNRPSLLHCNRRLLAECECGPMRRQGRQGQAGSFKTWTCSEIPWFRIWSAMQCGAKPPTTLHSLAVFHSRPALAKGHPGRRASRRFAGVLPGPSAASCICVPAGSAKRFRT